MGPIWGQQDPGGPHNGPINFAIWVVGAWTLSIMGFLCTFSKIPWYLTDLLLGRYFQSSKVCDLYISFDLTLTVFVSCRNLQSWKIPSIHQLFVLAVSINFSFLVTQQRNCYSEILTHLKLPESKDTKQTQDLYLCNDERTWWFN